MNIYNFYTQAGITILVAFVIFVFLRLPLIRVKKAQLRLFIFGLFAFSLLVAGLLWLIPNFYVGYLYLASLLAPLAFSLVFYAVYSVFFPPYKAAPYGSFFILLFLLIFYANHLGFLPFIPYDIYAFGYHPVAVAIIFLAMYFYGLLRKRSDIMILSLLSALVCLFEINLSNNAFDAILSPLWVFIFLYKAVKGFLLTYRLRSRQS